MGRHALMWNRSTTALASILLLFVAGMVSQAIPVIDRSTSAVSSRQRDASDQDDQAAAADDDDSSDDFQLLACAWDRLPSLTKCSPPFCSEPIIGPPHLAMSLTLESQHILLRL